MKFTAVIVGPALGVLLAGVLLLRGQYRDYGTTLVLIALVWLAFGAEMLWKYWSKRARVYSRLGRSGWCCVPMSATGEAGKSSPEANKRRSERVPIQVLVVVRGKGIHEETVTLLVSAHGALILLAGRVENGQMLELQHMTTGELQQVRVVHNGRRRKSRVEIGVEFLRPAPRFWSITFPPADWDQAADCDVAESDDFATPGG